MLLEVMSEAEKNSLIGPESRLMMEGVLRISEMRALDIMVAGPRIDMIDIEMERDELFHQVIDIGHSRYPVFENNRENIIGVLHSKDLLKLQRAPDFHLKGLLRNALYVPESKSLVDLLREFKKSRNHLALVVDEFGKIAGRSSHWCCAGRWPRIVGRCGGEQLRCAAHLPRSCVVATRRARAEAHRQKIYASVQWRCVVSGIEPPIRPPVASQLHVQRRLHPGV